MGEPTLAIGVDLGGTKVEAALVDARGRVVASHRRPTGRYRGPDGIVSDVLEALRESCLPAAHGRAIGVGVGTHAIYIFTHDSIGLGEDGPTHQPVEHLASLRAIPNFRVLRPADANETAAAWRVAVESRKPVARVLTREYQERVLPPDVRARLAVEAAGPFGWSQWVGGVGGVGAPGGVIGVGGFGASAPGAENSRQYGFTVANVVERARALLERA